jgi:hypothetical protein
MTMTTATPMVTSNLTPEELSEIMDVAVASKYGNNLTNFTCTITEEVRSTLDTFKTDLQNTLPRQIKSMVQQVQGGSHDKQPVVEPSTQYPSRTSTPSNTGTLYPGNTTASGSPGNIASVDVSYAAPQAHGIVNVALHREYSLGIVFIFSQGTKDLYHV